MSANLSIVIQGPVVVETTKRGFATEEVVRRARDLYPRAEIIYSGWRGEELSLSLSVKALLDQEIYSEPIDQNILRLHGKIVRRENTNRQIVSTTNGLRAARNRYVLKLRSDCLPVKPIGFEALNERVMNTAEKTGARIIATKNYTRIFFVHEGIVSYSPLHISDLIHFGTKESLIDFWDGELIHDSEFSYGSQLYTAEQMLCGRFIRACGFPIQLPPSMPFFREYEMDLLSHLRILDENFFFIDSSEFGVQLPGRFSGKWFERHLFLSTADIRRILNGGIRSYEHKAELLAFFYGLKKRLYSARL